MDINAKLRDHIDTLFGSVSQSVKAQEIKEEMLRNLTEKYYDLISEGKDEETAYSIAISSIGDVSSLLEDSRNSCNMEKLEKHRTRSALIVAISIMLYILSIIPPVVFSTNQNEYIGIIIMFIMIAAATGLLIFNSMTKPKYIKTNETMVEDFKEWQSGKQHDSSVMKSLHAALWSITVLLYLAISFFTGAWHVTWLIFLVAVAVGQIINLVANLKKYK